MNRQDAKTPRKRREESPFSLPSWRPWRLGGCEIVLVLREAADSVAARRGAARLEEVVQPLAGEALLAPPDHPHSQSHWHGTSLLASHRVTYL
jgi:hypothetical protein